MDDCQNLTFQNFSFKNVESLETIFIMSKSYQILFTFFEFQNISTKSKDIMQISYSQIFILNSEIDFFSGQFLHSFLSNLSISNCIFRNTNLIGEGYENVALVLEQMEHFVLQNVSFSSLKNNYEGAVIFPLFIVEIVN